MAGSMGYMAPEVLTQYARYNQKVDVWSLGVLLYILAVGDIPFTGSSHKEIKSKTLYEEPNYKSKKWKKNSPEMFHLT